MLNNKRIITCAVTGGIHSPTMSEYLPASPKAIADSAIEAADAGAAVVHIHARNEADGSPSSKLEDYKYIYDRIRNYNKEVIICLTTGGALGHTIEQRTNYIPDLKPQLASMNCGSINWGLFPLSEKIKEWKYEWEPRYYESKDKIFPNTFGDMEKILKLFENNNVKPELEIYDIGHLYNLKFMMDRGLVHGRLYIQFVLGITGAMRANPEDLLMMKTTADSLFGKGEYDFSAFGAGRFEYPICTQSLFLGGHVRVGLEDNLFLSKGVKAKSNADLVKKMKRIMEEFDYEPMTATEAKVTLGIK